MYLFAERIIISTQFGIFQQNLHINILNKQINSLGSLASFETAGGNTEGVPLLEEHEFESTTNSVSLFYF